MTLTINPINIKFFSEHRFSINKGRVLTEIDNKVYIVSVKKNKFGNSINYIEQKKFTIFNRFITWIINKSFSVKLDYSANTIYEEIIKDYDKNSEICNIEKTNAAFISTINQTALENFKLFSQQEDVISFSETHKAIFIKQTEQALKIQQELSEIKSSHTDLPIATIRQLNMQEIENKITQLKSVSSTKLFRSSNSKLSYTLVEFDHYIKKEIEKLPKQN